MSTPEEYLCTSRQSSSHSLASSAWAQTSSQNQQPLRHPTQLALMEHEFGVKATPPFIRRLFWSGRRRQFASATFDFQGQGLVSKWWYFQLSLRGSMSLQRRIECQATGNRPIWIGQGNFEPPFYEDCKIFIWTEKIKHLLIEIFSAIKLPYRTNHSWDF